jgi:8-oxo-dGTP pyrophosphatase MutT (NUDIX family)
VTDPALIERRPTVPARHAASLVVLRRQGGTPSVLMGMRGAAHRFMPNRLVFPGGAVERADATAPCAAPLPAWTRAQLEKAATPRLAHALAVAAVRELEEETGLSLGAPPALDGLDYLGRAITPPVQPVRFNARFLLVDAERISGTLAGSGELENLRFYGIAEALALELHAVQRRVLEEALRWLSLAEKERHAARATPLFRRRRWEME